MTQHSHASRSRFILLGLSMPPLLITTITSSPQPSAGRRGLTAGAAPTAAKAAFLSRVYSISDGAHIIYDAGGMGTSFR